MPDPIALSFLSRAKRLDDADPLRRIRDEFEIEENGPIYLDGNSLGRMPKKAREVLNEAADQWSNRLVRAWNEHWMDALPRISGKIAKLIGTKPDEVILADSTSVNLFKLVIAALSAQAPRKQIVTDEINFHSDKYVLQGIVELLGAELVVVPSRGGISTDPSDIESAVGPATALLALTHTCFKSSALHDMARLTQAAHDCGALALWDLSHSVGAVPVDLNGTNADLAIGCGYKYLNGGPGAPAFLYVRKELQDRIQQPIWGWLGHQSPFAFEPEYRVAEGMLKYLSGTPPVISLLALEPGVNLNLEAGIDAIRAKSIALSEFFIEIYEALLAPIGLGLASPRCAEHRGSHVSLTHPDALAIDLALIREAGVIPDFRAPDNIRFGLAPLYNSFSEVAEALLRLKDVVGSCAYLKYKTESVTVT